MKSSCCEAQRLSKTPGECTLLYFGADGYEPLKARFGPTAARKVIKDLADAVRTVIEEGKGVPGRIEENGFALFLPGIPGERARACRQDEIGGQCASPQESGQQFTISIGIANYPHTVKSFREIILNSRKAMEIHERGRNNVETGTS